MRLRFFVLVGFVFLMGTANISLDPRNPAPEPSQGSPPAGDATRPSHQDIMRAWERKADELKLERDELARKKKSYEEAYLNVKLDFDWSKSSFNVMIANFTFKNDNDFPIKDIDVRCVHSANSGTEIDYSIRTVYETVRAHGVKRVRNFNMGSVLSQSKRSRCSVVKVVPITEDLR